MNSPSKFADLLCKTHKQNLCEMIKQTEISSLSALFESKVEENRWRIQVHDSLKFSNGGPNFFRHGGKRIIIQQPFFTDVKLYNSTESTDSKSFRLVFSRHSFWLSSIYPDSSTHKHFYFALAISTNIFLFFFLSLSLSCLDVEIWCIFIVHDFKPTRLTRVTRAYHKTRECTESDEQPRSEFMRAKNIFGGNRSFVIWDEELRTFLRSIHDQISIPISSFLIISRCGYFTSMILYIYIW